MATKKNKKIIPAWYADDSGMYLIRVHRSFAQAIIIPVTVTVYLYEHTTHTRALEADVVAYRYTSVEEEVKPTAPNPHRPESPLLFVISLLYIVRNISMRA